MSLYCAIVIYLVRYFCFVDYQKFFLLFCMVRRKVDWLQVSILPHPLNLCSVLLFFPFYYCYGAFILITCLFFKNILFQLRKINTNRVRTVKEIKNDTMAHQSHHGQSRLFNWTVQAARFSNILVQIRIIKYRKEGEDYSVLDKQSLFHAKHSFKEDYKDGLSRRILNRRKK